MKRYREFVERVIGKNHEYPLKDISGGSILGSKVFVKEALGRLKNKTTHYDEISDRRELDAAFTVEMIVDTVARHFKVSPEDVLEDKKEKRNIAIYLIKKWTSMTNRQTGDMFGGLSYSAVSKANERFSSEAKESGTLKRTLNKISDKMSYVKG